MNIEMKMEVWDSPNSAGVVIDAVRCCKLALDNGISGALIEPSSYFKKSPPVQFTDDEARKLTEEFIQKNAVKPTRAKAKPKAKAKAKAKANPRKTKKPAKKTTRKKAGK